MRSLVCILCIPASLLLTATQYYRPYNPQRDAPRLRELVRSRAVLVTSGLSVGYAIFALIGSDLGVIPAALQFLLPLPAVLFVAAAYLAFKGIWPPTRRTRTGQG